MNGLFFLSLVVFQTAKTVTALTCHSYQCSNGNCFGRGNTCETVTGACQTQKTSTGMVEMYGCFDMDGIDCMPLASNSSGTMLTQECCRTDMCNNGTRSSFESAQNYCYSASCDSEGCLGEMISYIDVEQIGAFCKATENGCQTTKQIYGQTILETTGCAQATCFPTTQTTQDGELTIGCCTGHICNRGGDQEPVSGEGKCYVYSCTSLLSSASCLSLEEAVKQKKTSYCEKTEKGCFASSVTTGNTSVIVSGCVGQAPGFEQCLPASLISDDQRVSMSCCDSDLCNNGTRSSGGIVNPQKKYCHVYMCMSSSTSSCPSLTEAIKQGLTNVCEMTGTAGCLYTKMTTTNSTSINSACVPAESEEMCLSFGSWDSDRIIRCCKEDRCNPENSIRSTTASVVYSIGIQCVLLLTAFAPYFIL